MGLNRSFWDGRRVLVTGHTGFKGAWLTLFLEHLGADVTALGLEPPDHGAYRAFEPFERMSSHVVDLRDAPAVTAVVREADPEVVIHMAAQALEPVGYADPALTYSTNVMGAVHLLEAVRGCRSLGAFVFITSDKVYENLELGRPFKEDDPLGGKGPYSGSKACAETVVKSWRLDPSNELASRIVTTRAGNVFGGGDHSERRLLPDVFRALADGRKVELRNPRAVRPWQFVLNPLGGYLMLAERLSADPDGLPRALNFGPPLEESVTVGELVDMTLAEMGEGSWIEVGGDFPEAVQLRLDSSLAQTTLGWSPIVGIEMGVRWTADWEKTDPSGDGRRRVALKQIADYLDMLDR